LVGWCEVRLNQPHPGQDWKMQFKLKTLKTYLLAIKNVAPAEKAVTSKLPSHNLFLLKEQNNGHDWTQPTDVFNYNL